MTTTPTASPELPDLDRLEALARAATPGPWELLPVVDRRINHLCPVDQDKLSLLTAVHQDDTPFGAVYKDSDAEFIAAANPAAVLALIALARRAQPEGEAPQAEPVADSTLLAALRKYGTHLHTCECVDGGEIDPSLEEYCDCGLNAILESTAPAQSQGAQAAGYITKDAAEALLAGREYGALLAPEKSEVNQTPVFLAAQQAAAPDALDADEMTRLRRLMAALGHSDAFELTDDYVRGILCTLLGQAAGELERAKLAAVSSAPGTPEAPAAALHPIQPLVEDAYGRVRFKRNAIVDHLATDKLNDLAAMNFPEDDWEQLAQLIGYSLDGFGTLSYVKDETYERAAAQPVVRRAAQLDGGQGAGAAS